MIGYSEAPRAWGYTRCMARTLGYSLTDAVIEGWLSRKELGALVETCRVCGVTGQCTNWLARTVQASGGPDFCPNAKALAALKP